MKSFMKSWQADSSTDPFISLMVVATEDATVKQSLLAILKQDSFNRHSLLNTWINDIRLQGAPEPFINALVLLLDDEIATRALHVLEEND